MKKVLGISLGLACALMVDPITQKNACDLRNKLVELDNQLLYHRVYADVREKLGDLIYIGNVA